MLRLAMLCHTTYIRGTHLRPISGKLGGRTEQSLCAGPGHNPVVNDPMEVILRALATLPLAFVVVGCAISQPVILSGPNPADGAGKVPAMAHMSVTAGTVHYWPVAPKAWREMNDAVAPRAGRVP